MKTNRLIKLSLASCLAITVGLSVANAEMLHYQSGVTLDTDTKLLWQDNNDAKTVEKNWQGAIDYCENLNLAGFDDWILPNRDTLKALYLKKNGLQNVTKDRYWSNFASVYSSSGALIVDFNSGSDYAVIKDGGRLVRCVRDSNFDFLPFSSFLQSLKTLKKTEKLIVLSSHSIGSEKSFFLVNKDGKNYFGTKNELKKQFGLSNGYSKTPFETIQQLTQEQINSYLTPRKPINIVSKMPREIEKPILPNEINKPKLPEMPILLKDEFETKAMFNARVQKVVSEREIQIIALQDKYRQDVEDRNKKLEAINQKYQEDVKNRNIQLSLLQKEYDEDIKKIEVEQQNKKENLAQKVEEFSKSSFLSVMENIEIKSASYDAETEMMYVSLNSTNADYEKKVSFKVPLAEAKSFKENLSKQRVSMIFDYENSGFVLKNIEIQNPNEIVETTKEVEKLVPQEVEKIRVVKGFFGSEKEEKYTETIQVKKIVTETTKAPKTYLASLSTSDFKPETLRVALQDTKVDFKAPENIKLALQSEEFKLSLQNPNLVDIYQVQALGYGESNQAKGLKYNDDLTPIVKKLKATPTDNRKWLFAVAIEKYDEADAVSFAKNSANAFIEAAQKRFGISERNTYALIDEKATSSSIKDRLELMLKNVKEGDSVYFYYSGHGIPNPSEDGEPYILPKDKIVDFVTRDKEFMVRNIYKQLSDSKASKVVAFMDSCFSGNTDGVSNIKGVAATVMKAKKAEFDKSKMVVLTAGTNNQFSNAYFEKGHRLFSYYLTKAIAERPTIDIDSIYKDVAVKVKDESHKMGDLKVQEPRIEGNSKLGI